MASDPRQNFAEKSPQSIQILENAIASPETSHCGIPVLNRPGIVDFHPDIARGKVCAGSPIEAGAVQMAGVGEREERGARKKEREAKKGTRKKMSIQNQNLSQLGVRGQSWTQNAMYADWFAAVGLKGQPQTQNLFLQCQLRSGKRIFGWAPCRRAFVAKWIDCAHNNMDLAVYEIIKENEHCRLYLDIECTKETKVESPWIVDLLAKIDARLSTLIPPSFLTKQVTNATRVLVDRISGTSTFKTSFHVIYPFVVCTNNTVVMKRLFNEVILPGIDGHPEYLVGKGKTVLDPLVYTKNRQMRITYAIKETADSKLIPWDVKSNTGIVFDTSTDEETDWVERTFLTIEASLLGHTPNVGTTHFLVTHQTLPATLRLETKPAGDIRKRKPPPSLSRSRATLNKRVCAGKNSENKDREILLLLPLVGQDVSDGDADYLDWLKIGWIACRNVQSPEEGLELFRLFSQRSAKYSADVVERMFASTPDGPNSHGRQVSIGTLVFKAKQNQPALVEYIMYQLREKTRLDAWLKSKLYPVTMLLLVLHHHGSSPASLRHHHAASWPLLQPIFGHKKDCCAHLNALLAQIAAPANPTHPRATLEKTWCVLLHDILAKDADRLFQLLHAIIVKPLPSPTRKRLCLLPPARKKIKAAVIMLLPFLPVQHQLSFSAERFVVDLFNGSAVAVQLCGMRAALLSSASAPQSQPSSHPLPLSASPDPLRSFESEVEAAQPGMAAAILDVVYCQGEAACLAWMRKAAAIFELGLLLYVPTHGDPHRRFHAYIQQIRQAGQSFVAVLLAWSALAHNMQQDLAPGLATELYSACCTPD